MKDEYHFPLDAVETPCYVIEEQLLVRNLERLQAVAERTGAHILLAQKAFSLYAVYPLIRKYLAGTTASGLYEAKLGREEMGGDVHCFMPAYPEKDMEELLSICDHMVFNSVSQWKKYKERVKNSPHSVSCGLRINPEYAEVDTELYNPCGKGSRLGATLGTVREGDLEGLEGLHFHTMCEQNSDTLERTLKVVEEKFGSYMHQMKWINLGGGHHITREDYDVETLVRCIEHVKNTYDVEVYLEPGEAVALNAGFLASEVLDIVHNSMDIAILDTSAACHMPDVLEMPYRPRLIGSGEAGEKPYTCRLGGPTCLSGDIIGDYSFDEPLKPGDRLVFCDMAIYSFVKNNTFNGMPLPSIYLLKENMELKLIKKFGYEDFKIRLS